MRRIAIQLLTLALCAPPAAAVLPGGDPPVRTVWLIRHGEYEHDVQAQDDPDEGGLDALGRQQARLLADRLDSYPVIFTSLQSSTMARARQTAAILAERFPQLELRLHHDIRECTPPTRRPDIMADLEPGEAEACTDSLEAAWARIFRPAGPQGPQHDLVVCHGNVIRWFVTRVLEVDPAAWLGMSIANCSVTVVQIAPDGRMKLISFADSGHLPWSMTTYPGVVVEP